MEPDASARPRWAGFDGWAPGLILVLGGLMAPGIYQLFFNSGYLYYSNGADEPNYLTYEFSKNWQGLARSGQFLVTLMHECGLSGGWINFVFDTIAPCFYVGLVLTIGRSLALKRPAKFAVATLLLPILFTCANPLFSRLNGFNLSHFTVRYLTSSAGNFLPMARTPEPQFSLVILAAAVLVGLRIRSFWPVYPSLFFLYPFVAVPAGFVLLSLHLHQYFWRQPRGRFVACLAAFLVIALGSKVMTLLVGDPRALKLVVDSHLPMVSLNGTITLALWAWLQKRIHPSLRFSAFAIALSPWVGINLQVFSGLLIYPENFEQTSGCIAAAILLAMAMDEGDIRPRLAPFAWGLATLFFLSTSYGQLQKVRANPRLSEELILALRTESGSIAVTDGHLARLLTMVHPKQPFTALDYGRCWPSPDFEKHLLGYLQVRRKILLGPTLAEAYRPILHALDAGFSHQNQDTILLTVGRKTEFETNNDIEALSRSTPTYQPLRLIYVDARGKVITQ